MKRGRNEMDGNASLEGQAAAQKARTVGTFNAGSTFTQSPANRQRKLSQIQRQIAHEFMAEFGKKAKEAVSDAAINVRTAEQRLDTCQRLESQGMGQPGALAQAQQQVLHAKQMYEQTESHAEVAELNDLREMMDKVQLRTGISVVGALRAGEERAVRAVDRDLLRCFSCGNTDQGAFRTRHETGDTVCTRCGVVQSQRNAFDGDWTRSFEGEEDKSQVGSAPSHLHSASYNLRTSVVSTPDVSKAVLQSFQRAQSQIEEEYTHGAVKGERRTKDSTKDRQKERAFDRIRQVAEKLHISERAVATACTLFAQFRDNRENLHAYHNVLAACLSAALEEAVEASLRQKSAVVEVDSLAARGGGGAGGSIGAAGVTSGSPAAAPGVEEPESGGGGEEDDDGEFVLQVEGESSVVQLPGSGGASEKGATVAGGAGGAGVVSSATASSSASSQAPSGRVLIRSSVGPQSAAEREVAERRQRVFQAELRRRTDAVTKTSYVSIGNLFSGRPGRGGRGGGVRGGLVRGRGRGVVRLGGGLSRMRIGGGGLTRGGTGGRGRGGAGGVSSGQGGKGTKATGRT